MQAVIAAVTYPDEDLVHQTWGATNAVVNGSGIVDFGEFHDFFGGDPGDFTDLDFGGGSDPELIGAAFSNTDKPSRSNTPRATTRWPTSKRHSPR